MPVYIRFNDSTSFIGNFIVVLVLCNKEGRRYGAAFGSGSAGSVFGAAGSANFLSRTTAVAATIFLTTLALAYTNKGPNIESSAPVGIMEAILRGLLKKTIPS